MMQPEAGWRRVPRKGETIDHNMKEMVTSLGGPYLVFSIGGAEYGIAMRRVRQVLGYASYQPALGLQPFITGMIELEGWAIPVMDLRRRFGVEANNTELTCVIVVDVTDEDGGWTKKGVIVDALLEALFIRPGDIEAISDESGSSESPWEAGRFRSGLPSRTLLNIDRLFSHNRLRHIPKAA